MLFHTHEFFVLLAATLVLFRWLPAARQVVLLSASLVFYAYAGLGMGALFLAVVVFNYACYRRVADGANRVVLVAAVAIDLANLFFFKYTRFFLSILGSAGLPVGGLDTWLADHVILPVGISFYTFQMIALLIDSARGGQPRTHSFVEFFLFVTFFGQLIAGPIMRGREFLPQLRRLDGPSAQQTASAVGWLAIGLVKKVVFADVLLAPRVDALFDRALSWDTPTAWFLGILFGFQIYYDFSGYCDMAIGLGKLFGLELRVNFSTPYVSRTPSEFWSRWNITLSRWFGDYVYIPLGGSRVTLPRTLVNLMITMLASGLWHGAGYDFLIWGGLHGVALCVFHAARDRFPRLRAVVERGGFGPPLLLLWLATQTLTAVAWVYFRAATPAVAHGVVAAMFGLGEGAQRGDLVSLAILSVALFALHFAEYGMWLRYEAWVERALRLWSRLPGPVQAAACFPFLLFVIALTKKVQGAFIYFQF